MEVNTRKVRDVKEKSHSPKCEDIFGNPSISPRIGEQFQAELPPLMSKSSYGRLQRKNSNDEEIPHGSQMGKQPITTIWKEDVEKNVYPELKDANESIKSIHVTDKTKSSKQECAKEYQERFEYENSNSNSTATAESALTEVTELGESGNFDVQEEMEAGANKEQKGNGNYLFGNYLFPEDSTKTWTETEKAGLTLGLYIFGKNLVAVERFLRDHKTMGDILSFYHGKFYGSDGHRRWSKCKNMKGRKCIHGSKIFTRPRLRKILSRLLPNLPDECGKPSVIQLAKAFSEGKVRLDDFVVALKALVGLESLVNAVGIGRGTQKSNQVPPACPQLPPGKPYEMLTCQEIITYLTGNFRISKSRSSEIFWEAVWPRLLDRGWHSEVPPGKEDYIMSSKLFFFVPGVENFSRKLVKGNHYFDSHTDVLSKVISEPELIEYEPKENNDSRGEDEKEGTEAKSPQESSSDQQVSSDPMPPIPDCGVDVMKFTIVATSLTGEKLTNLRELKSLADEIVENPILISDSEDDEDTPEEKTNQDTLNILRFEREKSSISKATAVDVGKGVSPVINGGITPDNNIVTVPKKRRKMTSCTGCKTPDIFLAPGAKLVGVGCSVGNPKSSENVLLQEKQPQESKMLTGHLLLENKTTLDPQSSAVSNIWKPVVLALRAPSTMEQDNKPWTQAQVDLNLPVSKQVEVNAPSMTTTLEGQQNYRSTEHFRIEIAEDQRINRKEEAVVTETAEGQQNDTMKESGDLCAGTISQPVVISESQSDSARRRSTRSRTMTTKALEAFAIDNSEVGEMRKRKNSPQDSARARHSKRARVMMTGETCGSSGTDFQREESSNGALSVTAV